MTSITRVEKKRLRTILNNNHSPSIYEIMKSLDEFVALFADQFDESDVNLFTPETRFRDLDEWSSILSLSIIAMVDEEFDVALRANDFRGAETIADLYRIISVKLG